MPWHLELAEEARADRRRGVEEKKGRCGMLGGSVPGPNIFPGVGSGPENHTSQTRAVTLDGKPRRDWTVGLHLHVCLSFRLGMASVEA